MGVIVNLYGNEKPSSEITPKAMEANAFRTDIIRPALKITNLWSMAAENLVLGTALVESGLNVVKQYGDGPALGFTQVEPNSYYDVVKYLNIRQRSMRDLILTACYLETFPDAQALVWNLRLAVLVTRVIYYRRPEPLPTHDDIPGLAAYYKLHYNTPEGDGSVKRFIECWEDAQ